MFDRYNRPVQYLRVAVTDRCNHRCTYCMPAAGVVLKHHDQMLSYEQIVAVVGVAAEIGIRKVRLTGGEPLVRKGIEDLVARLSPLSGVKELCMTTNGTRLPGLASKLKTAGLDRVNISIDSLNPERYGEITRGGVLGDALAGLEAAVAHELTPVKINMVVFSDTSEAEIDTMRAFCELRGVALQLINHFTLHSRDHAPGDVPADRPPRCEFCNRLRLTADGYLKPCLFSEDEIRVDFDDIRGSLLAAVSAKPRNGTHCRNRLMHAIGG